MLKIENVTFGYNAERKVLEDFSLEFAEPGVYGLLGKNGTGKSTLLYLIMGLLHPKSGKVMFCGQDTKRREPEVLSEMFIVPEEYNLPRIMLSDYIRVMSPFYPNFSKELLVELLDASGMMSVNDAKMGADGLPCINLGALSMGQKKKIYLCMALACRTKLLLMDEPTNGLDIPSKSLFRKVVARGMRDDQIVIISTHQVKDVEMLLDHVTIIDQNRVLVNEALDTENPLDLEEMFINVVNA